MAASYKPPNWGLSGNPDICPSVYSPRIKPNQPEQNKGFVLFFYMQKGVLGTKHQAKRNVLPNLRTCRKSMILRETQSLWFIYYCAKLNKQINKDILSLEKLTILVASEHAMGSPNNQLLFIYSHMVPVDISINKKTASLSFLLCYIFEAILLTYSIYLSTQKVKKLHYRWNMRIRRYFRGHLCQVFI